MDKFSKEFLFKQCNINNHCLCLNLSTPIYIDEKIYDSIYLMRVVLTKEEEILILSNIKNNVDTYGEMTISFFVDNKNPLDTIQKSVNTNNIYEVEYKKL